MWGSFRNILGILKKIVLDEEKCLVVVKPIKKCVMYIRKDF